MLYSEAHGERGDRKRERAIGAVTHWWPHGPGSQQQLHDVLIRLVKDLYTLS
jgi:hypothetical protein